MTNASHQHPIESLQQLQGFAPIAFAAAAIEHALPVAASSQEVSHLLRRMLDEVWAWQSSRHISGHANMSPEEARQLPSRHLYDAYGPALHRCLPVRADNERLFNFVGGSLALHGFIVWDMDRIERGANPDKPFVLGSDILEVGWSTLSAGLAAMVAAAPDPDREFAWHQRVLDRLVAATANVTTPDSWQPFKRDYFVGDIGIPDLAANNAGQVSWNRLLFDVEQPFHHHAAIAFATAALERVLNAASAWPEVHGSLKQLVRELWDWQTAKKIRGHERMSEEDAKKLSSYRFYSQVGNVRAFGPIVSGSPKAASLISAVEHALLFISYTMDEMERRDNDWKPAVVGGDDDIEVSYDTLIDALTAASEAADDAASETTWQKQIASKLRRDHPGNEHGSAVGGPVSRAYFD